MKEPETNRVLIRKLGGKLPFLRYIVPFYVDYGRASIEETCRKLHDLFGWDVQTRAEMVPSHEEDLYNFFYTNLSSDKRNTTDPDGQAEGAPAETNLGFSLTNRRFQSKKLFYHFRKDGYKQVREFEIADKGMLLFRNGISFYWYDVRIDMEDPDELVIFQNRFKELNTVSLTKNEANQYHFTDRLKEDGHIYTLGNDIAKELSAYFETVSYFPSRVNVALRMEKLREIRDEWQKIKEACREAYPGTFQKSAEYQEAEARYRAQKEKWTAISIDEAREYLSGQDESVRKSLPAAVPDRAVLYSYIVFDAERNVGESEEEKQDLISSVCKYAYYFARGYKESYKVTKDAADERKHMFFRHENDIWEASLEGCGCFVLIYNDLFDRNHALRSNTFYDSIRVNEMKGDYFIMLIHLLYQYYSMTRYSEEISEIVQQNSRKYTEYSEDTEKLYENVLAYKIKLDLFFCSCMYKSISHTTDMGRIYSYIEENMQIRENLESVRQGIANLESLEKSILDRIQAKRKEKLDNVVSITGVFLAIISLILGYDDIVKFAQAIGGWLRFNEIGCTILAVALFVIMIGLEVFVLVSILRFISKKMA